MSNLNIGNDEKELLIEKLGKCLIDAYNLRHECKKAGLLHEQFYLNWEDELNKLSTMDPDADEFVVAFDENMNRKV